MLLEAASAGGRVARERAEELVRLVVDLYGAGLERLLEIVHEAGRLDDDLLDRLAADDLVAGLLRCTACTPTTSSPGWRGRWRASGPTSVRTAATSNSWASPTTDA